jgi:hypothetical protein
VLVPEIAAFGEAAHVEHAAPVRKVQVGAFAAHDARRIPLRLHAPTVQDRFPLAAHGDPAVIFVRIAHNVRIPHNVTNASKGRQFQPG